MPLRHAGASAHRRRSGPLYAPAHDLAVWNAAVRGGGGARVAGTGGRRWAALGAVHAAHPRPAGGAAPARSAPALRPGRARRAARACATLLPRGAHAGPAHGDGAHAGTHRALQPVTHRRAVAAVHLAPAGGRAATRFPVGRPHRPGAWCGGACARQLLGRAGPVARRRVRAVPRRAPGRRRRAGAGRAHALLCRSRLVPHGLAAQPGRALVRRGRPQRPRHAERRCAFAHPAVPL